LGARLLGHHADRALLQLRPPFHDSCLGRLRSVPFGDGQTLRVLSAQDLLIFKVLFDREKGWHNIPELMHAMADELDGAYVDGWLNRILDAADPRLVRLAEAGLGTGALAATGSRTYTTQPTALPRDPATLRGQVLAAIVEVAPDLAANELEGELDLHYDLGLDSIDLLNIAGAISQRTGIEIPESAAPTLRTLTDLVDFVVAHREVAD
jgi:acyl carrier protein